MQGRVSSTEATSKSSVRIFRNLWVNVQITVKNSHLTRSLLGQIDNIIWIHLCVLLLWYFKLKPSTKYVSYLLVKLSAIRPYLTQNKSVTYLSIFKKNGANETLVKQKFCRRIYIRHSQTHMHAGVFLVTLFNIYMKQACLDIII